MSMTCSACRREIEDGTERLCATIAFTGGQSRSITIAVVACSTTCLVPAVAYGWPTPLVTQLDITTTTTEVAS